MLKITIVTLLFSALLSANAIDSPKETKENLVKISPYPQKEICVANITDVNRRGCCSRHGGVCGCEGKRVKCCDDTLSPTCKCGE
ncbi:MAG: hypothetical protein K2N75_00160 [Helicobacter sp.]|uniref:hypothetical protein n=1 Tax=Helicobacter sp. TaxID=218 RepID=UPI0023C2C768|nr:hypothetical protein [Helicobacter sp.]MDE5925606.1 hypothetical protein [Helicobacter sp.]MDE7174457.1 hypothetical protein [Helicobacter sp.]